MIFSPSQWGQIVISDIGTLFWVVGLYYSINKFGFFEVFRTYVVPYLWYVAWILSGGVSGLISFLGSTTGS